MQRAGLRRLALAGLAATGLLCHAAAPAVASPPTAGDGMWVWYVSASGGSADAIAKKAKRHELDVVFVKSGDGVNYWSQFSPALVDRLHRSGIDVCAWQFVYGSSPGREAAVGAAAKRAGADCLVIDAEASYEGRYAAADRYVRRLRSNVGRAYPLALSSFPYVDYHPAFPYSVFLGRGGAEYNLPQIYWLAIGDRLRTAYKHTYAWNRLYRRPIFPIGQTWQNPSRRQIKKFRAVGAALNARGISWWSWQETQRREWGAVTGPLRRSVRAPGVSRPRLARGAAGDPVVLLQALLRAADISVPVNGHYRSRTVRAVRRFQRRQALPVSGVVDGVTWQRLLERRPVRIRWARRGSPNLRSSAPAPASAALPAFRYETLPVTKLEAGR